MSFKGRMRRKLGVAVSLAGVVLPSAAIASSQPNTPTSDTVPIASGEAFGKPIRISACDEKFGLCLSWRSPVEGSTVSCGIAKALPKAGRAIEIYDWGVGPSRRGRGFSNVIGMLRPDVASVQVYFHRGGKRRSAPAILGQASAEKAAVLHQPHPFGAFLAVARGCVSARWFRAVALGADGTILGTDRGFSTPWACKRSRPRGTNRDG